MSDEHTTLPEMPSMTLSGRPAMMAAHFPDAEDFEDDQSYMYGNDPRFSQLVNIGQALIDAYPELQHLRNVDVAFLWQKKGGKTGGRADLATIRKTSGLLAYYSRFEFVVMVAADLGRSRGLTNRQLEALIYSILLRIGFDEDDKLSLISPNVQLFTSELERYGAWNVSVAVAAKAFEQLSMNIGEVAPPRASQGEGE